ncbi:MAG: hypothetical protein JSV61_11565 [Anaerolineales bacterium]|nr:MAG: hypothetical protein JSV61_11565 [Anaerolineales bacterium]
MHNKLLFQAAAAAALVAFLCTLVMGFVVRSPDPALSLQPSTPSGTTAEFIKVINTYPQLMLRFFTADSLFVLSYLVVFFGLFVVASERSFPLAWLGLGAGILAAILDATENAFFINYALLVANGVPLTDPELPLIYHIANLKYMAAFAAFYAFGLVFPRQNWLGWVISVLMLAFPLIGVLGNLSPLLYEVRGLFLLVGMALFCWYFLQRTRA